MLFRSEMAQGKVTLKNMETGEQTLVTAEAQRRQQTQASTATTQVFFNIIFVCSICLFSLSQNFFHLTDHSFYFIYCTDTYVPEIKFFPLSV